MFKVKMLILTVLLPSMLQGSFRRSMCGEMKSNPCQKKIQEDIVHCRTQLPEIDSNIRSADLRAQLRGLYDELSVNDEESSVQILMRKTIKYIHDDIGDEQLSEDKRSLFAWATSLFFLGDLNTEGKTLKLRIICQDAFAAIQLGLIADDLDLDEDEQGFMMMLGVLARAGNLLTIVNKQDIERRMTMVANSRDLTFNEGLVNIFDKDPNHEKKMELRKSKKNSKRVDKDSISKVVWCRTDERRQIFDKIWI